MAGSYPDTPGRRIAWDADGTVFGCFDAPIGAWTERSSAEAIELNDEDETNVALSGATEFRYAVWIFPELREFDGLFVATDTGVGWNTLWTSGDTTNGYDGTFTVRDAAVAESTSVGIPYRSAITSHAVSNVRAVKLYGNFYWNVRKAVHMYGEIAPGQTPDRLLFIDEATGLEFTGPQDYGNVPRGSSLDNEWRMKNNSATLTATTIQYTVEALSGGSNSWYTHTTPGGSTYSSTQALASLAPATTSGLITTRQIVDGASALGLKAARLYLNVGSWA